MGKRYFTEEEFVDMYGTEMANAESLFEQMTKNGLKEYALTTFDFSYTSDSKEKLEELAEFLSSNYDFKLTSLNKEKKLWELSGDATEFPVDQDNLFFWVMDLYCKGYEFDCRLSGYGAVTDPADQPFPEMREDMADHYFDLAMAAFDNEFSGMAAIHLSTAIKINPDDPNAWYSRAIANDRLHMWKAARRDYDKAIELAPEFTDAIVNRAVNKDNAGEYEEALKDYDRAIELSPEDATAWFNRGNTKYNMEDTKGACKDWKKAKELGSENAQERIDECCG